MKNWQVILGISSNTHGKLESIVGISSNTQLTEHWGVSWASASIITKKWKIILGISSNTHEKLERILGMNSNFY